jgi:uncharacterized membrane protein
VDGVHEESPRRSARRQVSAACASGERAADVHAGAYRSTDLHRGLDIHAYDHECASHDPCDDDIGSPDHLLGPAADDDRSAADDDFADFTSADHLSAVAADFAASDHRHEASATPATGPPCPPSGPLDWLTAVRTVQGGVAPSLDDPVARAASGAVGGPLGRRAVTGRSWWTPLRVTLAVATVVFGLGILQKSPCVVEKWSDAASPLPFSHMCYSDIAYLYVDRGLAESIWPLSPQQDLPPLKQPATVQSAHDLTVEYPVVTAMWMGLAGEVTSLVGKSPDLSQVPHSQIGNNLGVQYDSAVFWSVNAVGFFLVLVVALVLLVRAQPRRPWDALFVAGSPSLALAAMINWDMLAVGCVAGIVWAWAKRRPVVTGLLIGLGTATKLYPLFFLGPLLVLCLRERRLDAWVRTCTAALAAWLLLDLPVFVWSPDAFLWFWHFNASRGADFGSLWLLASSRGYSAGPSLINLATLALFGSACLAIAALGLLARRRPRLVQLVFLVVASFLLVNKVYSPQYVLWLLPLAALARPRWRDLLIWQACEIFYFFAIWMHIGNFFVAQGAFDWVYSLAILVRVAGEVFLMGLVVRDILRPERDPVRADGLSDDPLGGIFDKGIDAERPMPALPSAALAHNVS